MRKSFYSLVALASMTLLPSCMSEAPTLDNLDGNTNYNYKVVTYKLEGPENGLRTTPITNSGVKSLLYLIYNSDGNLIKERVWSHSENINMIKDTLAQGNYKVVFFGTSADDSEVNMDPSSAYSYDKLLPDGKSYFYLKEAVNVDMFYRAIDLTVSGVDLQQNVSLPRIVGRTNILIQDAASVPADVVTIQVALAPEHPTVFQLQGEQTIFTSDVETNYFLPVTPVMTRAEFLAATANNTVLSFTSLANTGVYNTEGITTNLCFTITKTNGRTQTIYIKENFEAKRNITTRFEGPLFNKFDTSVGLGDINVEDEWNSNVEVVPIAQ